MSDLPSVPAEYQQYNSYETDPAFQLRFTYAWLGLVALCAVYLGAPPALYGALRSGRLWMGWTAYEELGPRSYAHLEESTNGSSTLPSTALNQSPAMRDSSPFEKARLRIEAVLQSLTGLSIPIWHLPSVLGEASVARPTFDGGRQRTTYLPLTVGQLVLGASYTAAVAVCVFLDAELVNNSNRLGFLALAQLTPLLLLATKNNPLAFVLTLSYEHLNWAHRWAGRLIWLCATAHGAIWINQLGGSEVLIDEKMQRGLIAYGLLCAIALTSIRPIRQHLYGLFWITHFLCFTGFFAAVAYHTTYAVPWVYPPAALYAFDLCARLAKARMLDALLVPLDGGMTLIHLPDLNRGWLPTQHCYVRVLAASWHAFESHPLTILSSPPSAASPSQGVTLLAFSAGDWSHAVHRLASSGPGPLEKATLDGDRGETAVSTAIDVVSGPIMVRVILDGPHGGLGWKGLSNVDLAVCIAGGSGVAFLLGVAEEAVREFAEGKGRQLRAVRLVWILRDIETYEAIASLFRPLLSERITLALYLTISVEPQAGDLAHARPHVTITHGRPDVASLVLDQIAVEPVQPQHGVRVVACGPPGLVKDVRLAVGSLDVRRRADWGGVDFCGEGYGL